MRKLCSALALRTGVSTFSTRRCLRRGEPSAPAARSSKVRAWLVMIYAAFGVAMHRFNNFAGERDPRRLLCCIGVASELLPGGRAVASKSAFSF